MSAPRSTQGHDFEPLSHAVIGACIDVQRQLGVHCMEVDYQRALALALREQDLFFQREVEIPIAYDGVVVTKRRVDFVILVNFGQKPLGLRRFVHTPAEQSTA